MWLILLDVAGLCEKGSVTSCHLQKWTLKEALEFVVAARPGASPNAGFLARLLELDEKLYGRQTVKVWSSPLMGRYETAYLFLIIVVSLKALKKLPCDLSNTSNKISSEVWAGEGMYTDCVICQYDK